MISGSIVAPVITWISILDAETIINIVHLAWRTVQQKTLNMFHFRDQLKRDQAIYFAYSIEQHPQAIHRSHQIYLEHFQK